MSERSFDTRRRSRQPPVAKSNAPCGRRPAGRSFGSDLEVRRREVRSEDPAIDNLDLALFSFDLVYRPTT